MIETFPIIFLHIPKAAGTSFIGILSKLYPSKEIYQIDGNKVKKSYEEFTKFSIEKKLSYKLIFGHMPFGIHQYLPKHAKYITFLRDPIKRVISGYNYIIQTPNHYLYNIIKKYKMSIDDYINSQVTTEIDNGQLRLLAGVDTDLPFGKCDNNIYKQTINNISEYFQVVGLTERFDESLILIKRELNWNKIPYYYKYNVSKKIKSDISPKTIKLIEKYNEFDLCLYEYVKNMFNDKMQQNKPYFLHELKLYKINNELYRKKNLYFLLIINLLKKIKKIILKVFSLIEFTYAISL